MRLYRFKSVDVEYKGDITVIIRKQNNDTIVNTNLSSTNKKKETIKFNPVDDESIQVSYSGNGVILDYKINGDEL